MYNKYRITVVVLMVVRSSRMQRTRTIAAAIKSIYYARVCYIRAIYSLPLSVSFSLSLSRLFSSMHTHHSLALSLFIFHTFTLLIINSYSSFSFSTTPYIFLPTSYHHHHCNNYRQRYYVFGRKSLLLSSLNALAKHR